MALALAVEVALALPEQHEILTQQAVMAEMEPFG